MRNIGLAEEVENKCSIHFFKPIRMSKTRYLHFVILQSNGFLRVDVRTITSACALTLTTNWEPWEGMRYLGIKITRIPIKVYKLCANAK